MENKHKDAANAVCELVKGCGYDSFACAMSTAYNFGWNTKRANHVICKLHVVVADGPLYAMRMLKEDIEEGGDDFLCWDGIAKDEVFIGFCGEADSVESLQEWLNREPELAEELDLSADEEDEG